MCLILIVNDASNLLNFQLHKIYLLKLSTQLDFTLFSF